MSILHWTLLFSTSAFRVRHYHAPVDGEETNDAADSVSLAEGGQSCEDDNRGLQRYMKRNMGMAPSNCASAEEEVCGKTWGKGYCRLTCGVCTAADTSNQEWSETIEWTPMTPPPWPRKPQLPDEPLNSMRMYQYFYDGCRRPDTYAAVCWEEACFYDPAANCMLQKVDKNGPMGDVHCITAPCAGTPFACKNEGNFGLAKDSLYMYICFDPEHRDIISPSNGLAGGYSLGGQTLWYTFSFWWSVHQYTGFDAPHVNGRMYAALFIWMWVCCLMPICPIGCIDLTAGQPGND